MPQKVIHAIMALLHVFQCVYYVICVSFHDILCSLIVKNATSSGTFAGEDEAGKGVAWRTLDEHLPFVMWISVVKSRASPLSWVQSCLNAEVAKSGADRNARKHGCRGLSLSLLWLDFMWSEGGYNIFCQDGSCSASLMWMELRNDTVLFVPEVLLEFELKNDVICAQLAQLICNCYRS